MTDAKYTMTIAQIEQEIRDEEQAMKKLNCLKPDECNMYFVREKRIKDWKALLLRRNGKGRTGRPRKNRTSEV